MKKIVIKRNDGGVSILIPGDGATPELLERDAKAVIGYVSHREVDDDQIPFDRTFRNAWTDDLPTNTVDLDFDRVRSLIREKRNRALAELDTKAVSESRKPNGNLTAIDAEAQRLRDIPSDPSFNTRDEESLKRLYEDADVKI